MINIITRTHNRPNEFNILKSTLEQQTYKDYNWIVGSDTDCPYYPDAIRYTIDNQVPVSIPFGHYHAPWNLYLNRLQEEVKEGYVMYIDDDDCFKYKNSLEMISKFVEEDKILIWKVEITPKFIVPSYSFGKTITAGDFSGIGFCFHSKHLPVDWGCYSYGDYRVGKQLEEKGLKLKFINVILTRTQNGAHNGK